MTSDTSLMMELFHELIRDKMSIKNCKECPHSLYESSGLKCKADSSFIEECNIIRLYWE